MNKELEEVTNIKENKLEEVIKILKQDIRQCENEIIGTQGNQSRKNMSGSARRHLSSLSGRINEAKRILKLLEGK